MSDDERLERRSNSCIAVALRKSSTGLRTWLLAFATSCLEKPFPKRASEPFWTVMSDSSRRTRFRSGKQGLSEAAALAEGGGLTWTVTANWKIFQLANGTPAGSSCGVSTRSRVGKPPVAPSASGTLAGQVVNQLGVGEGGFEVFGGRRVRNVGARSRLRLAVKRGIIDGLCFLGALILM